MNANEISPKLNPRLKRIKIVSRIAKCICFVFFVFTIVFLLLSSMAWSHWAPKLNVWRALLVTMFQIVLCIWYWKLSRLFCFYERGLIFAAETIRCIKILGFLFVTGGLINSILRLLPKSPPPVLPPGVTQTTGATFHMGFFTFDFGTPIDFGLLLAGSVIIVIAWIMDEGRKIQAEQELTV